MQGYWFWKPIILLKTLNLVEEGDIIIYTDSGSPLNYRKIKKIKKKFKNNPSKMIITQTNDLKEKIWTKRDLFLILNMDKPQFYETGQIESGAIAIRKNKFTKQFINEWVNLSKDPRALTDLPNKLGKKNYKKFQEHRHDQSIFSLLCKKNPQQVYYSNEKLYIRISQRERFTRLEPKKLNILANLLFIKKYYLNRPLINRITKNIKRIIFQNKKQGVFIKY